MAYVLVDNLKMKLRETLFSNRQFSKIYYSLSFSRPVLPHRVGAVYYRTKSSWDLKPHECPCDLEFLEYLHKLHIQNQTIFHFGTGAHHILGLENQKLEQPNEIIGITASNPEHEEYVRLCLEDRSFSKHYKVICADIYNLTTKSLPMLDVVSLFHLCEFYMPEEAKFVHHDDASLLDLFLSKLNPGGKVLFYKESVGWGKAKTIVDSFVEQGKIQKIDGYKNLLIYGKIN
jgi:hypothetical protein